MDTIRGILADFGLAWRLLLVVPLPLVPYDTTRPAGWSAAYFPLIGLEIGLLLAGAGQFFSWFLPKGPAAALLLVTWVGLTGMLHLDGFIDACDGLLPPREPARRLEIMKDSRVGAFGVAGAVLLLLLKFNGLAALSLSDHWPALIVIPALARWAMTWTIACYPLARVEGLSVFFKRGVGWRQVGLASATTIVAALILSGSGGVILIGLTWVTATLVARFAVARLGGLTGDIYGAICELAEAVLLLAAFIIIPGSDIAETRFF
jgi:adenosylcobinamide-GDP ribazoletransferase